MKVTWFKKEERLEDRVTLLMRDRAKKKFYVTTEVYKGSRLLGSPLFEDVNEILRKHPGFELEANDEYLEEVYRKFEHVPFKRLMKMMVSI